jgi:uncharacterized membrane protein (DUF2068 family)
MTVARVRPVASLAVGAIIAGVQGVALLIYAAYITVQTARLGITGPEAVSSPVAVTLEITIFGLFGVAMVLAARGLWRARRWSRSLLVVGQFIALVIGVPLATADGGLERGAGIALVVVAIVGLVAAFWPTTTAAVADS